MIPVRKSRVDTGSNKNPDIDQQIFIYLAGSCIDNPGPGGYAAIIQRSDHGQVIQRKTITGSENDTTNNRMVLLAALEALACINRYRELPITVRTDSQYLVNAMTLWLQNWIAKNWRTAGNKRVENQDLFEKLKALCDTLTVSWEWTGNNVSDTEIREVGYLALAKAKAQKEALDTEGF